MKGFRAIRRYFRDAIHGVFRNFSLSLASILCITITLIVVAVSLVLSANVENFSDSIRKDVTVVMFLKSNTTIEDEDKIKKELESIDNIDKESIKLKSKVESALELNDYDLSKYSSIGVTSGASTPREIFDEVLDKLNN